MQKPKRVSKNVIRVDDEYWHYYIKISKKEPKITGKYLFFSEYKDELNKIAIEELEKDGFFHAKINTDEHKKGEDYVLCLYDVDDSRKFELAERYKNNDKVEYRYWKSDESTLKGIYSERFLETLSPEERKLWIENKLG
ncbi:hypothetical protein HYX00_02620 [Candidatus Woesearchaeota archaeon]|nr:hypothetical protein [Candidatus Woesearchaeota archaeon]